MEMILISLCLTSLLAFLFLKRIQKRTTKKINLPPSPWRLPVIGNLHQLSLHPHRSLHSLSLRHGPIMLLRFGSVPVLIVSSADVAHDVMKTHDLKFANRPAMNAVAKIVLKGGRNLVLSPYGEYWRQMKSLCVNHLLGNKMVRSFEKLREEEINVMIEKLEKATSSSSWVNLSEIIFNLVNTVVSRVCLGRKYSGETRIVDVKKKVRDLVDIAVFPVGDYIPCLVWVDIIRGVDRKLEEASETFHGFLENVVQEHEDQGDDNKEKSDLVDMLLRIQREKPNGFEIDRLEIKLIILDIFIAGTTTTSALLEWTMTELMRDPETMKKLQEDIRTHSKSNVFISEEEIRNMKYLKAVIKEVLRIHPSAPVLVPRQLSEDVKLMGYDIAAGTQVIINAWAIQRDPATWGSDAEEFKPERHLDSPLDFQGQNHMYIPFGSGRRLCPGIGFAMALAEVTLANLVNRFNWKVEVNDDQYDLAEAIGMEVGRKFPLIALPSFL